MGKGTTALVLPASVWGFSHTLAGFWWVAERNGVSKDPQRLPWAGLLPGTLSTTKGIYII